MTELSEAGAAFLAAMTSGPVSHPRFRGERLEVLALTPHDLGRLLSTAYRIDNEWAAERALLPDDAAGEPASPARVAARDVIVRTEHVAPVLSAACASDVLAVLAERGPRAISYAPDDILRVIAGCEASIENLATLLAPLLPTTPSIPDDAKAPVTNAEPKAHGWVFLARIVGTPEADALVARIREVLRYAPLLLDELEVMSKLPPTGALTLARLASQWALPRTDAELDPPGTYALGQLPAYMAFAERALATALERVERIHAGYEAYAADKAFVPAEGQVLGRCARAALDCEASWLAMQLGPVWLKTSVAPGTAKTMPSQSVAIALGRAVEEMPTAAALITMRRVANAVRHAGVKKKLGQMLRTAERRIAERPDLVLQLPAGFAIPKPMLTAVKKSFEHLYRSQSRFSFNEWQARFQAHADVRAMAGRLIWRVEQPGDDAFSAIAHASANSAAWQRVDGTTLATAQNQVVSMWHPLHATPMERDAWRDVVMREKLEQPVAQAFRQFYVPASEELQTSETAMFAGHAVSIKPVMGVAKTQGWLPAHGVGLSCSVAGLEFHLDLGGSFYPGYEGATTSGPLRAYKRRPDGVRVDRVTLATVEPVVLSEVLRGVDLLVSVGTMMHDPRAMAEVQNAQRRTAGIVGYAGIYFPPDPIVIPVGHSADMRREVLRRLYAGAAGVSVGARHVDVGGYLIHLGTARVTRDGEPVEVDLVDRNGKVAWLPYHDAVLQSIVRSVATIRDR